MAKKKEPTVEEKLRALYDLQLIDSRIDKIRDVRGELPLEVRDLEDDIEGLNKRIEKLYSKMEWEWQQLSISNPLRNNNSNNSCLLYTSPSPRDQRGSGLGGWG